MRAEELVDGVGGVRVSPLISVERRNPYGSVPGLDDEELATPEELERQVMLAEWGPVLALPVRGIKIVAMDWKRYYRDLLQLHPDLRVYTIGRKVSPFRFNPLIPPPGATFFGRPVLQSPTAVHMPDVLESFGPESVSELPLSGPIPVELDPFFVRKAGPVRNPRPEGVGEIHERFGVHDSVHLQQTKLARLRAATEQKDGCQESSYSVSVDSTVHRGVPLRKSAPPGRGP